MTMLSDKQSIIDWLYRNDIPAGVHEFDGLLVDIVMGALNKNGEDALAHVERNCTRYWNDLLQVLDIDEKNGRTALIKVHDRLGKKLSFNNDIYSKSTKNKRWEILRHLDQLTARQFEAIGCVAGIFAGLDRYYLTPPSNEGGVDFFATLKNPGKCHVFNGNCRPLRIIGQSKKYVSRVDLGRMRDFNESINNVRYQNEKMEKLVPPWFRSSEGPVVGWMIAHSGVQVGAATQARNHGVIVSDSIDIAEIITFSKIESMDKDRIEMIDKMIPLILANHDIDGVSCFL